MPPWRWLLPWKDLENVDLSHRIRPNCDVSKWNYCNSNIVSPCSTSLLLKCSYRLATGWLFYPQTALPLLICDPTSTASRLPSFCLILQAAKFGGEALSPLLAVLYNKYLKLSGNVVILISIFGLFCANLTMSFASEN